MNAVPKPLPADGCPVCGGDAALEIAELKDVPVHPNVLWSSEAEAMGAPRGSLVLAFCETCGLIWNRAFDPDALRYETSYENSLHFSPTFQAYASELADRLVERHAIRRKTVVEIGSGKGEFLALLCAKGENRGIGFDPSYDGESDGDANGSLRFVRDVFDERSAPEHADLLVCRHVLEHVPAPLPFLETVRRSLGDADTVVYFEVPAAEHLLAERAVWDLIYPHVTIFGEAALRTLFEGAGFAVLRTGFSFGGQYLWIEARPGRAPGPAGTRPVRALGRLAAALGDTLHAEQRRWEARLEDAGGPERAAVWGAGAKGTMFLNLVSAGHRVGHVVDVNPRKHGKHVPGAGQPISSPEELASADPGRVVVMNPIYRDEIAAALAALGCTPEIDLA